MLLLFLWKVCRTVVRRTFPRGGGLRYRFVSFFILPRPRLYILYPLLLYFSNLLRTTLNIYLRVENPLNPPPKPAFRTRPPPLPMRRHIAQASVGTHKKRPVPKIYRRREKRTPYYCNRGTYSGDKFRGRKILFSPCRYGSSPRPFLC